MRIRRTRFVSGYSDIQVKNQLFDARSQFLTLLIPGIRPWVNFKWAMQQRSMLKPLVELVSTYFRFMIGYIEGRPYVPPSEFKERKWLAFRAIFLKVYKAREVTLTAGHRVKVSRIVARLKPCSMLRVTKGSASCYAADFSAAEEPLPEGWAPSNRLTTMIGTHGLGVGAFMWWGQADKLITLSSPQKAVSITYLVCPSDRSQKICLRPSTLADLTGQAPCPPPGEKHADGRRNDEIVRTANGRGSSRLGGRARKIYFLEKKIGNIFI